MSAAQLMATNGRSARGLLRCAARATSSLPVPLSPRSRIVESVLRHARDPLEQRAHRAARPDHVVLEIDLGAQLLVPILETRRLVPLFARDGGQRGNHQEQAHVPFVERRARRGLHPRRARGTAERHERRDDRLPTVDLDDERRSLARGALEKRRRRSTAARRSRPARSTRSERRRSAGARPTARRGTREPHPGRGRRSPHRTRQPANRAERGRRPQQRREIAGRRAWRPALPPPAAHRRSRPERRLRGGEGSRISTGQGARPGAEQPLRRGRRTATRRCAARRAVRSARASPVATGSPLTKTDASSSSVSTAKPPSPDVRNRQRGRPSSGALKREAIGERQHAAREWSVSGEKSHWKCQAFHAVRA